MYPTVIYLSLFARRSDILSLSRWSHEEKAENYVPFAALPVFGFGRPPLAGSFEFSTGKNVSFATCVHKSTGKVGLARQPWAAYTETSLVNEATYFIYPISESTLSPFGEEPRVM